MTADLTEFAAKNFVAPKKEPLPKDWQTAVEFDGSSGKAGVSREAELTGSDREKERTLLEEAGFDPESYMIAGTINYRKWMRYDFGWLHYYKFDIVRLSSAAQGLREMDIAELTKLIRKPRNLAPPVASDDCWAGIVSDWQIGKGEGDGTAGTITRVSDSIDLSVKRVKELRRIGRKMSNGALLGTGDLVEGTCGFYSNQPYLIDMNDREQTRVVMALLTYGIEELSPLFDDFLIATSLDNHGQKRQDGKIVTDLSDNKTAECYDNVYTAFQRDSRYTNLRWVIPNDETSVLVELGGVPVGLTHGDLFYGGGKLPQAKALEWWKGQDFGMQPLRGAKVLLSGHFHHYSCLTHGPRTHFQMPAMDPGSDWFRNSSGIDSPPGMLTLRFDNALRYGWADEAILL